MDIDYKCLRDAELIRLCQAIALIGLPSSIDRLLEISNVTSETGRNAARRGLATLGYRPLLEDLLPRIDQDTSTPGIQISSGEHDLLFLSPPDIALEIAVGRIRSNPQPPCLKTSMQVVHWYGDVEHNSVFQFVIENVKDLNSIIYAFQFLFGRDPDAATSSLRLHLGKHGAKVDVELIKSLVAFGVATESDVDNLLQLIFQVSSAHGGAGEASVFLGGILKTLENAVLGSEQEKFVIEKIQDKNQWMQYYFWSVGEKCKVADLGPFVRSSFESGDNNIIQAAARYVNKVGVQERLSDEIQRVALDLIRKPVGKFNWTEVELLRLLSKNNRGEVREIVCKRIDELFSIQMSQANGSLDNRLSSKIDIEHRGQSLINIAGNFSRELPREVVEKLLKFDFSTSDEETVKILADIVVHSLDNESVDSSLQTIKDDFHKAWSLSWICPLGKTEWRSDLFLEMIKTNLFFPAICHNLCQALPFLWDVTFGQRLISVLSEIEITDENLVYCSSIINQIGSMIDNDFAKNVMPEIISNTKFDCTKSLLLKFKDFGERSNILT